MKNILFTGALVLVAVVACSSPQKTQQEEPKCPASSTPETTQHADVDASVPKVAQVTQGAAYQAQYPATASAEPEEAFTEFASNAFPPTMPEDSSHADAWMKDDCLRCHEDGLNDAPRVTHRDMSRDLMKARCRTCHLPGNKALAAAEGASLDELLFARNAFPPTLPNDQDHKGGWLRDDCLKCHQAGIGGAPKVLHQGMSSILLEAQCRTCHVVSAPSGEMDYPEK